MDNEHTLYVNQVAANGHAADEEHAQHEDPNVDEESDASVVDQRRLLGLFFGHKAPETAVVPADRRPTASVAATATADHHLWYTWRARASCHA